MFPGRSVGRAACVCGAGGGRGVESAVEHLCMLCARENPFWPLKRQQSTKAAHRLLEANRFGNVSHGGSLSDAVEPETRDRSAACSSCLFKRGSAGFRLGTCSAGASFAGFAASSGSLSICGSRPFFPLRLFTVALLFARRIYEDLIEFFLQSTH